MSDKKHSVHWGWLLVIAACAGGALFYLREQEARQCRQALAHSLPISGYGGDADAALALAADLNRQRARDCYVRGLLSASD